MQRIRLGFDFDINKNVRAHAMLDSNRTFGGDQSTIQGNTADTASMKQAYLSLETLVIYRPLSKMLLYWLVGNSGLTVTRG